MEVAENLQWNNDLCPISLFWFNCARENVKIPLKAESLNFNIKKKNLAVFAALTARHIRAVEVISVIRIILVSAGGLFHCLGWGEGTIPLKSQLLCLSLRNHIFFFINTEQKLGSIWLNFYVPLSIPKDNVVYKLHSPELVVLFVFYT